jgi:hypothetical protein
MIKRTTFIFVLFGLLCVARSVGQTVIPGTPAFCTTRPQDLYCLLPILFDEANPNPFSPITSAFATQLTQLPLASPASGIIYAFDSKGGVPHRVGQETYGPVLTERGDTIGRYKLFIASTYQRFTFSSLDGIGLNNIPVVFNVCTITGQCAPIGTTDRVKLTVNQVAIFGTFGITNWIDVSVAAPVNNISESAGAVSCNPCNGPLDYSNPTNPIQYIFQKTSKSGSKTGIGDLVFRVKVRVLSKNKYRLALGGDFRAPSGDALNFLGSGAPGARPFAAFSRGGQFSPHINVAFQWNGNSILGSDVAGTSGKLANDIFYSGGMDGALGRRVTLAVDYLGDYVDNQFRLSRLSTTIPATSTTAAFTVPDVAVVKGSFNTVKGTVGLKYNPVKNLLITGNVLFRFDHNGLRNNPVPLAGISYSF